MLVSAGALHGNSALKGQNQPVNGMGACKYGELHVGVSQAREEEAKILKARP